MNGEPNTEALNEISQDFLFILLIFTLKRNVKDILLKELMGEIGVFALSIFTHELAKTEYLSKNDITAENRKILNDYRQRFLKKKPAIESEFMASLRGDMAIDFDHYVFDLVLMITRENNTELFDINFALWDMNHLSQEREDFFEELTHLAFRVSTSFLQALGTDYKEVASLIESGAKEALKNLLAIPQLDKKSYSSNKLFKATEANVQDKLIVLYRYSLIHTALLLDKIMPWSLEIKAEPFFIKTSYTSIKLKAIIIELLFQDIKNLDTPMIQEINNVIEQHISDKNFFSINRKMRNNIHYGKTQVMSKLEYEMLERYQNFYLETILNVFKSKIFINFGIRYKLCLWIAKFLKSKSD